MAVAGATAAAILTLGKGDYRVAIVLVLTLYAPSIPCINMPLLTIKVSTSLGVVRPSILWSWEV